MKWVCFGFFLLGTLNVKAQVGREQVEDMLQQMIKENVISEVEGEKAKIRLRTMNAGQWRELNRKADKIAARSPSSITLNEAQKDHIIDLDGAQFRQIQHEMKKIIPRPEHR